MMKNFVSDDALVDLPALKLLQVCVTTESVMKVIASVYLVSMETDASTGCALPLRGNTLIPLYRNTNCCVIDLYPC